MNEALTVLRLCEAAWATLEFLPPCQVEWVADRANEAALVAGFGDLRLGPAETVRRRRMAELRRLHLGRNGSTALPSEIAEQAIERAKDKARRIAP